MLDFEFLADLPTPQDGEPPSLRDDIVDELADHLHCALRRELLVTADEPQAERRVLDRFGDPGKLARRLWRQAMWSRIMRQRIVSGLQWALTLVAVGLAGAVLWQQSTLLQELKTARAEQQAERQALSNALNRLVLEQSAGPLTTPGQQFAPEPVQRGQRYLRSSDDPQPNVGTEPSPSTNTDTPARSSTLPTVDPPPESLVVTLVDEQADARPVLGAKCILRWGSNSMELREESYPLSHKTHEEHPVPEIFQSVKGNRFAFPSLKPDHYSLEITLSDGQQCIQRVLIRDDKPQSLTVVCPAARQRAPVVIMTTPLPDDLRKANFRIWCQLFPLPLEVEHGKWRLEESDTAGASRPIDFGGNGLPEFIEHTEFSPETPQEDRVAFLPQGPFRIRLKIYRAGELVNLWSESEWPRLAGDEQTQTVKAGENRWQLELSAEMIADVRKRLANTMSEHPQPAQPPVLGESSDGRHAPRVGSADNAKPLGNQCRLVVKLASETKDGPFPPGASVWLLGEHGVVDSDASPEDGMLRSAVPAGYPNEYSPRPQIEFWAWNRLEPGRYKLQVKTTDGCTTNIKLPPLRPGQERIEHITCPPPSHKAMLLVTAPPVPEDLRKAGAKLRGHLELMEVMLEGHLWVLPQKSQTDLSFSPETGLVEEADRVDLRTEAPQDRLLFLPAGSYRHRLTLTRLIRRENTEYNASITFPPPDQPSNDKPDFIAQDSEGKWEMKIPDKFWDDARKHLEIVETTKLNP